MYEIGPCTCGHTMVVEADNEQEALDQAVALSPSHIEEYHRDDPMFDQLLAMTPEETAEMMRPLVHAVRSAAPEPAFGERLISNEDDVRF